MKTLSGFHSGKVRVVSLPESLESARQTDIFTLFPENIGALTPLLSDDLREAEDIYPAEWIEEAFRIAPTFSKRSWRYVCAILER